MDNVHAHVRARFLCPNGHPYFIGDCGGARMVSKCPEKGCKAFIGGSNYQLEAGNRHAADFEGSSAPAWNQPGVCYWMSEAVYVYGSLCSWVYA